MNPTVVTQSRPLAMSDAAQTPARPTLAPQAAPPAVASTTNIVDNIPMHAPARPPAAAPNEDAELDTIMQDIGHELKQADRQITKKRFSLFSRKPKTGPRPAATPKVMDVSAAQLVPRPAPAAARPAPQAAASIQPTKTSSVPVGIILITVLVTGVLIAAAIYSYK